MMGGAAEAGLVDVGPEDLNAAQQGAGDLETLMNELHALERQNARQERLVGPKGIIHIFINQVLEKHPHSHREKLTT